MKLHLVLDNIRSAYNVGSIFRTADGAGGCVLHICGISPTPEHIKVKKTALGSADTVEWNYYKTTEEAVKTLQDKRIPVYAVELIPDAQIYSNIKYPEEVALVLGHETEGVGRRILEMVDKVIYVPMFGKKESLNVATTAGIVIYEIAKSKFTEK